MTSDPDKIKCPECGAEIAVAKVLADSMREGLREEMMAEVRREKDRLRQEREAMELEKESAVKEARSKAEADARRREEAILKEIAEKDERLAEQRAAEQEQRRRIRELEEKERESESRIERVRDEERRKAEEEARRRLAEERVKIEAKARDEAAGESILRIRELEEKEAKQKERIAELLANELDLRKQKEAVETARQEMDLTIARKLDEERSRIAEQAAARVREEERIKLSQKDEQLASMSRTIEDLRRKAEQGSMQTQGEAQETQLEERLRAAFPQDQVEPVGKGVKGADIRHEVRTRTGEACGVIVWECKQTKNWSAGWIDKVKADLREAKGDVAVIASTALPPGIETFGTLDGVWVTRYDTAAPLAAALRTGLEHAAMAARAGKGREEKEAVLFRYITGNEFFNRVAALVEVLDALRKGIDTERKAFEKAWAMREKQVMRASLAAGGLWGDLSGITGTLRPITSLEMGAIAVDVPARIDAPGDEM